MALLARIYFNGVFGGLGGLLGWLLFGVFGSRNPGDEAVLGFLTREDLNALLGGLIIGGAIGYLVVSVEALRDRSALRFARQASYGVLLGAVGGAIGMLIGDKANYLLIAALGRNALVTMLARAVGWSFLGMAIGMSEGIAARSLGKVSYGTLGGALGGFVGGGLFGLFYILAQQALSTTYFWNALGLVILGACIGALSALVQAVFQPASVKVMRGWQEGREYPLEKPATLLGRDEHADIALFRDMKVEKKHALIKRIEGQYVLVNQGAPPQETLVNDSPVPQARELRDGDRIQLGNVLLRFQLRAAMTRVRVHRPLAPVQVQPQLEPLAASHSPVVSKTFASASEREAASGFPLDGLMPPRFCPRCNHTNPEIAVFCYYDGAELVPAHGGAYVFGRLAREFVFPDGRRCTTFDELALGCQDEWPTARNLLRQGAFREFFATTGRLDLAQVAEEAMRQQDADIGLTTFLGSLPITPGQGPRLDLHPRRLILGNVLAGETRELQLTISNHGKGLLQGTMSVEGAPWLRLVDGADASHCALRTAGEQQVVLQVDTRGLEAAKTYGAKLKVVTNGGIVEVPAGMNLIAQPFPSAPLQGVRTPREMAVKMRGQPKMAVPLLESGEVARWFRANGWEYPVRATQARGVAGVQQFFECMGLSKPPEVRMSSSDVRLVCRYPELARGQVFLQTSAKKWVYAKVESDSPWLRVHNPQVAGPQQAAVGFSVDPRLVPGHASANGKLLLTANAGQALAVLVRAEVRGAPGPAGGRLLQHVLGVALVLLLLRLILVPFADCYARPVAQASVDAPFGIEMGNWMRPMHDQFVSSFVRGMALSTWWIGAVIGVLLLRRRGAGWRDWPWGLIAGAAAGLAGGAGLGCLVLLGDLAPAYLWELQPGGLVTGAAGRVLWILLVLWWWACLGALVGLILGLLGPLGRVLVAPPQRMLARVCGLCGFHGAAAYFATS